MAAAVGYFGVPLALTLGGAVFAGSEPLMQLVGGGGGLLLGIALTTRVARHICAIAKEQPAR